MPAQGEADYQNAIVDLARLLGYRVYHTFDSRRSAAGFPDLVMTRNGRLLAAEIKSPCGKPTAVQRAWLSDLDDCPGVEVHVWRAGTDSLASIAAILRGGH